MPGNTNQPQESIPQRDLGYARQLQSEYLAIARERQSTPPQRRSAALKLWYYAERNAPSMAEGPSYAAGMWEDIAYDAVRIMHQEITGDWGDSKYDMEFITTVLEDMEEAGQVEQLQWVEYLMWVVYYRYPGVLGDKARRTEESHQREKELAADFFRDSLSILAFSLNLPAIRRVLDGCLTVGSYDVIRLLGASELEFPHRVALAVEFANTFGFINVIDTIAAEQQILRQDPTLAGDNAEIFSDLQSLYDLLQGEHVKKIFVELEELYQEVSYGGDEKTDSHITAEQVQLIETNLVPVDQRTHQPNLKIDMIDIGGGVGRVWEVLHELGYENVIGIEFNQDFVDKVKQKHPEWAAAFVQGDWHQMSKNIALARQWEQARNIDPTPAEMLKDYPPEYRRFYCVNRTAMHNRRAKDHFNFFSEVCAVTAEDAEGIIDMPKVEVLEGEYGINFDHLATNLRRLNINAANQHFVFDGPREFEKFNRQALSFQQLQIYGQLFQFRVTKIKEADIPGTGSRNVYYKISRDGGLPTIEEYSWAQIVEMLENVGLWGPDMPLDLYVRNWGMTFGQMLATARSEGYPNRRLAEQIRSIDINFENGLPREIRYSLPGRGSADDFD